MAYTDHDYLCAYSLCLRCDLVCWLVYPLVCAGCGGDIGEHSFAQESGFDSKLEYFLLAGGSFENETGGVRYLVAALVIISSLDATFAWSKRAKAWQLNLKKSKVTFFVDAKLENVTGRFQKFAVQDLKIKKRKRESLRGKLIIDVASVKTGKRKRDRHLREDDFFDAKKHPSIIVSVLDVNHDDEDDFEVEASIEIKGKERKFTIPVEITASKKRLRARGKFYIDRKAFGVNGNIISNAIVDDKVIARFDLRFDWARPSK